MQTKRYYIMGLPASGKTTFLVAFTYMLMNYTRKVGLHMKPDVKQEGLTESFQKEINRWTNFEPLTHTAVGQVHRMKYVLYDEMDDRYELEVPDVSGETFSAIIKDRYIDDKTLNDWMRADTILFFINLDKMNIGDSEELLTEMPISVQNLLAGQNEQIYESSIKDMSEFPGQFALVELLQILCHVRKKSINIKFIISAWDNIEALNEGKDAIIPEEIFSEKLPLVYQFINASKGDLMVQYWGVSAQGSSLEDSAEIERMSFSVEPMERVKVVDTMGKISFDLSKIFME